VKCDQPHFGTKGKGAKKLLFDPRQEWGKGCEPPAIQKAESRKMVSGRGGSRAKPYAKLARKILGSDTRRSVSCNARLLTVYKWKGGSGRKRSMWTSSTLIKRQRLGVESNEACGGGIKGICASDEKWGGVLVKGEGEARWLVLGLGCLIS